jgi:hypothetical protein
MRVLLPVTAGVALVLSVPSLADDAVLTDGRTVHGHLALTDAGRLAFTPTGQKSPIPIEQIGPVRLANPAPAPWRVPAVQRVALADGQGLTGEFLGLDAQNVSLRTAWADRLTIPRRAVLAVTHAPGFVPIFTDDFEAELKAWNLTGPPVLSDAQRTSGQHSLCFSRTGQTAEYVLASALEAGRVGVNFLEAGAATGAHWVIEADFQGATGPRPVRGLIAGEAEGYRVEVPDGSGAGDRVPRTPGWHRYSVEFSADSLLVTVDEAVLWYSRRHGPGGLLRKVRLACVALPSGGVARGEVLFDDFNVARAVERLPHQFEEPGKDELWLLHGDQLFGEILKADRRAIDLRSTFGVRTFAWSEVRGIFLRRQTPAPQTTDGEHVRLWLHSGCGSDLDQLEGTLQALDERRLTLRHPVLGELAIDRGRVRELRRLFHGRRIELDDQPHHLGQPGKLVPHLQPPQGEGLTLRRTFRLEDVPHEVRLVLHVAHLRGPGDGIGAALERGDSRTEVVVNGKVVDYLNRHVERATREPRRLSLSLPADALRVGENVLELRLTQDRGSGRYEHCGVSGLRLEMPRAP